MKLIHFSDTIVKEVKGRYQIVDENMKHRGHPKPRGFWVSDESDYGWKEWCIDNEFRPWGLRYEHEVTLSDKAKILYIRTPLELRKFTREYRYTGDDSANKIMEKLAMDYGREEPDTYDIDWARVAKKYHGIIITPYIYTMRLDMSTTWYYGWDCASGCIWNRRAVESIKMVKEHSAPPRKTEREHRKEMEKGLKELIGAFENLTGKKMEDLL